MSTGQSAPPRKSAPTRSCGFQPQVENKRAGCEKRDDVMFWGRVFKFPNWPITRSFDSKDAHWPIWKFERPTRSSESHFLGEGGQPGFAPARTIAHGNEVILIPRAKARLPPPQGRCGCVFVRSRTSSLAHSKRSQITHPRHHRPLHLSASACDTTSFDQIPKSEPSASGSHE